MKYKQTLTRYCYAAAAGMLVVTGISLKAPRVHAAVSDFEAFGDARQLSDEELAGMRGRFVNGSQIMFFGISMTSQWRTSSGEILTAGAVLGADVSGSSPVVSFTPHLTAKDYQGNPYAKSGETTIISSGATNGHGIVQTIQAGGDENEILNDLQINIQTGELGSLPYTANGKYALESDSGAQLTVHSGKNGLATQIYIPNQGLVSQQITPHKGLHQSVELQSSYQQINNLTQLNIQIAPVVNRPNGRVAQALKTLHGLQR